MLIAQSIRSIASITMNGYVFLLRPPSLANGPHAGCFNGSLSSRSSDSHGAGGLDLGGVAVGAAHGGLHDLVEGLVGHDARDEQLRRADVVERQRLDLGDVHAHLAVDARALDADDHAEVG